MNIRQIQEALNIGFDSTVFLDDNPFERSLMRELVPGVLVLELPEDPADLVSVDEFLQSLDMRITVARFDAFHLPRISQLIKGSSAFAISFLLQAASTMPRSRSARR